MYLKANNPSFGAKVSKSTCEMLYKNMLEVSSQRMSKRMEDIASCGSKDSVISYRLNGAFKDCFVLTNDKVSSNAVPLSDNAATNGKGMIVTFFDSVTENAIKKAEALL